MNRFKSVFPNVTVEASYNALDQIISYNDLSRTAFNHICSDPFNIDHIEKTALVVHETCHYVDHLSTLKGQQLLNQIYNAYNAMLNQDEYGFFHVADLFKTINGMSYSKYYKTLHKSDVGKNPLDWSFETTLGARFDHNGRVDHNKPIIFNRFKYRGELVARIPFSTEALWETNAMAEEIKCHMRIISSLTENEQIMEAKLYEKKLRDYIYTPELLIYSSPVHLVSSLLDISDIYVSYIIAKSISSISLNLPKQRYSEIKATNSRIPESRLEGLINGAEPSSIYYSIFSKMNEHRNEVYYSKTDGVDTEKILYLCGLPPKHVLEKEVEEEILKLNQDLIQGPLKSFADDLREAGITLFRLIGIDSSSIDSIVYTEFAKASMNLCGEEILDDDHRFMKKHNELERVLKAMNSFMDACGY